MKSPVIVKGFLIKLSIFDVWVYKKLYKFPVTIEGIFKNFTVTPHQISVENSSTIEGTLKKFKATPPQNEVQISITIERILKKLKKFHQMGTQTPM